MKVKHTSSGETSISSLCMHAVARGEIQSLELLKKAATFLQEYFPKNERTPFKVYLEIAKMIEQGEISKKTGNHFNFFVAQDISNKIIGVITVVYLNKPALGYIEYIRVIQESQNQGIGRLLWEAALSFCQNKAAENGKSLSGFIAEIEHDDLSSDRSESKKRRSFFNQIGFLEIDPKAMKYTQPSVKNGVPLSLILWEKATDVRSIGKQDAIDLVREIYDTIYFRIPQSLRDRLLTQVVSTILDDEIQLLPL